MRVVLRPLITSDVSWAGVVKYKNCYEDIAPYWTRSGSVYTGLTPADAKRLGEVLGKDLTPGSDYWENFWIRSMGKDIILNTEDPMDELRWLFLRNHKKVKDSIFAHKATANFVLINQEEESKKTNLFNKVKRTASSAFDKMTPDEMRKALRIFGKSAENLSSEVVENRLYDIIEGDPNGFLEKWVNNKSRDTQYLIERAVSLNILRKNKRIYNYGSDVIGHGLEETIVYLDDPKNNDVRVVIEDSVAGKKNLDKPLIKVDTPSLKEQPKQQLTMKPVAEVKEELQKTSK